MKKTVLIISLIIACSLFCQKDKKDSKINTAEKSKPIQETTSEDYQIPVNPITKTEMTQILMNLRNLTPKPVEQGEIAIIETKFGSIKFKLFPDIAPKHCAVFKMLANSGFYNGITFHRVIPGFMIQGGDILSRDNIAGNEGTGNPGFTVPAEFSKKSHKRGIVSAARRGDSINSASSQFFICHADSPYLDGQYSIFGEVIEGMDVVDKIANVPVNNPQTARPIEDVMMQRVRVIKE